jgi:NADH-quinone oxidoreductase subunit K
MILVVLAVAGGLFASGIACLIARRHLIKMVMGLEFLGKGVSTVFVLGGYIAGDGAVSQAVVFTLIAIEAVIAGLALALAIVLQRTHRSFDSAVILRHVWEGP